MSSGLLGSALNQTISNPYGQRLYPDDQYTYTPTTLSVHRQTNGWLVKCGGNTYVAGDDVQQLLDTISLALVRKSVAESPNPVAP